MSDLWEFFWPAECIGRAALLIYYAATIVIVLLIFDQYIKKAYRTAWFDIARGGWLEKLQWDPDVKILMTQDPLEHTPSFRTGWPFQALRDLSIVLFSIFVWIAGIHGISFLERNLTKENIEAATFLIGFLGFAGTSGKVVYEWRLKARSENRQKWINDIREILAKLIEKMPRDNDTKEVREDKEKIYFELHGKLELLLNPSERDHRALMALIRHIYGYPNLPIDKVPREQLDLAKLDPVADFDKLKSHMIRLSNVALKREWERVKHIQ